MSGRRAKLIRKAAAAQARAWRLSTQPYVAADGSMRCDAHTYYRQAKAAWTRRPR